MDRKGELNSTIVEYLDYHDLIPSMRKMAKRVVTEQKENPWEFLCEIIEQHRTENPITTKKKNKSMKFKSAARVVQVFHKKEIPLASDETLLNVECEITELSPANPEAVDEFANLANLKILLLCDGAHLLQKRNALELLKIFAAIPIYKEKFFFFYVDDYPEFTATIRDYLGLQQQTPCVVILDSSKEECFVFPKDKMLSVNSFTAFMDGFFEGTLKPLDQEKK